MRKTVEDAWRDKLHKDSAFVADPNNTHFCDRYIEQTKAVNWAKEFIYSLPLSERLTYAERKKIKTKYDVARIGATECDSAECAEFIDMIEDIFGREMFKQ